VLVRSHNWYHHRYLMIYWYSYRALTFPSGVLPALSGLASALARACSSTHLFGLWQSRLQVGLCWFVYFLLTTCETSSELTRRVQIWPWIYRWGNGIVLDAEESGNKQTKQLSIRCLASSSSFDNLRKEQHTVCGHVRMAEVLYDAQKGEAKWVARALVLDTRKEMGTLALH